MTVVMMSQMSLENQVEKSDHIKVTRMYIVGVGNKQNYNSNVVLCY